MSIQKLEQKLNNMTPKEVREYAREHYQDIHHFSTGSKESNIDAIVLYEENSALLGIIEKVAKRC